MHLFTERMSTQNKWRLFSFMLFLGSSFLHGAETELNGLAEKMQGYSLYGDGRKIHSYESFELIPEQSDPSLVAQLKHAIDQDNLAGVTHLLEKNAMDLNQYYAIMGGTPLRHAICSFGPKSLAICELLIKHGARVDGKVKPSSDEEDERFLELMTRDVKDTEREFLLRNVFKRSSNEEWDQLIEPLVDAIHFFDMRPYFVQKVRDGKLQSKFLESSVNYHKTLMLEKIKLLARNGASKQGALLLLGTPNSPTCSLQDRVVILQALEQTEKEIEEIKKIEEEYKEQHRRFYQEQEAARKAEEEAARKAELALSRSQDSQTSTTPKRSFWSIFFNSSQ